MCDIQRDQRAGVDSVLRAAGVEPLRTVTATRRGHLVELDSGEGRTVELDGDHAHAIQVEIVS